MVSEPSPSPPSPMVAAFAEMLDEFKKEFCKDLQKTLDHLRVPLHESLSSLDSQLQQLENRRGVPSATGSCADLRKVPFSDADSRSVVPPGLDFYGRKHETKDVHNGLGSVGFHVSSSGRFDFPVYDGCGDLSMWKKRANDFFAFHRTPEGHKVTTASFNLYGDAQDWYWNFLAQNASVTWSDFLDGLDHRFGASTSVLASVPCSAFALPSNSIDIRADLSFGLIEEHRFMDDNHDIMFFPPMDSFSHDVSLESSSDMSRDAMCSVACTKLAEASVLQQPMEDPSSTGYADPRPVDAMIPATVKTSFESVFPSKEATSENAWVMKSEMPLVRTSGLLLEAHKTVYHRKPEFLPILAQEMFDIMLPTSRLHLIQGSSCTSTMQKGVPGNVCQVFNGISMARMLKQMAFSSLYLFAHIQCCDGYVYRPPPKPPPRCSMIYLVAEILEADPQILATCQMFVLLLQ